MRSGAVGLALFRFVGPGAGLVPRSATDPDLVSSMDRPSALSARTRTGPRSSLGDPVVWVRPPTIEATGRRLRALENDAGENEATADGALWPFGRLCCETGTPTLVVGRIRLERLARARIDQAAGVVPPSWPVRFVPIRHT